jgi:hypothetical protein
MTMGESYITIRASFRDATESTPETLRSFFDDCKRAYDWWLHNRDGDRVVYWTEFQRKYPQAYAFLKWRHDGDIGSIHPGEIAGQLSWAGACTRRRFEWKHSRFQYVTEAWSGAETVPVAVYLMAHFKAQCANIYDGKYPRLNSPKATWDKFYGRTA